MSPVSGPEDKDPARPSEGVKDEDADEVLEGGPGTVASQGVDVNEATLSEPDTLQGEEALEQTRERHEEMAKEDEAAAGPAADAEIQEPKED